MWRLQLIAGRVPCNVAGVDKAHLQRATDSNLHERPTIPEVFQDVHRRSRWDHIEDVPIRTSLRLILVAVTLPVTGTVAPDFRTSL